MSNILNEEMGFLTDKETENLLFERFGDQFLEDSIRIISTGFISPLDKQLINEALCIIVAMYSNKVRLGEINKDKVMH